MSNKSGWRFAAYDYLVSFVVVVVTVPAVVSAVHGTIGVWEVVAFCLAAILIAYYAARALRGRGGPK